VTAAEVFRVALLDLAERGQRVPCEGGDGEAWVSESLSERRRAARLCGNCSVLDLCAAAADETGERWGVWAGRDRTRKDDSGTSNDPDNSHDTDPGSGDVICRGRRLRSQDPRQSLIRSRQPKRSRKLG
jgi:hypothetical protein